MEEVSEKKRGRPPNPDAKSGADRQAAYRERKKAQGIEETTVQLDSDVLAALKKYVEKQNKDVTDGRMTIGHALNKIVRDRLLRPR